MSSKARNAEKRRENEVVYVCEYEMRQSAEGHFKARFGVLEAALEDAGIDTYLLVEWLTVKLAERYRG